MKLKALILFLLVAVLATACEKKNKSLDPDAKVSITGVRSVSKADVGELPSEDIAGTGLTDSLEFITRYALEIRMTDGNLTPSRWIGAESDTYYMMRDFENWKLKFWASDAITSDGLSLSSWVTLSTDIVLIVLKEEDGRAVHPLELGTRYFELVHDTVAYIPNAAVLEARAKITAAFNQQDYESCYKIFDDTYVFVPTTGEKWRAMKAADIE